MAARSIPAASIPQVLTTKGLAVSSFSLTADRQRNLRPNCPSEALSDAESPSEPDPAIEYIRRAWPEIPPHIKDAVFTLIDAATLGSDGNPRKLEPPESQNFEQ